MAGKRPVSPFASAYSRAGSPGNPYRAYTVSVVRLNVEIIRRKDDAALFEGRAQLRSDDDAGKANAPPLLQRVFAERSSSSN